MNYFFALAICFAMSGLSANEDNARWLLICDINVALYLALAWFLGFYKKRRGEPSVIDLQQHIDAIEMQRDRSEQLLREVCRHPDTPDELRAEIRQRLRPAPRCP